jgi:hypothetical protein
LLARPIGVRVAATMTASFSCGMVCGSLSLRV